MDTTICTLRTLKQFLEAEGYRENFNDGEGCEPEGDYVLFEVPHPNEVEEEEVKFHRELGFTVRRFSSYEDLDDWLECLFCGGLYTAVAIFIKGRNVTRSFEASMATFIPLGNCPTDDE